MTLGIAVAAICAAVLAWWYGFRNEVPSDGATPKTLPETLIAQPYRQLEQSLTAVIGYNRTLHLLRVENRDTFPWSNCLLSLNSRGFAGYELQVDAIKPGLTDATLLPGDEFTDSAGKKFDPATEQVTTLDLDCETPRGRLYYGGRFGSQGSAGR